MNERRDRYPALKRWGLALSILLVITGTTAVAQSNAPSADDTTASVASPVTDSSIETTEPQSGCGRCSRHPGADEAAGRGCSGRNENGDRQRGPHASAQPHPREGSGGQRPEMELAHFLIANHERLTRRVEILDNGVRTTTTTEDPELVGALRSHVRQMASLLAGEGRIRNWDPVFREIFDHRDAIELEITDIDNGIEVVEVSQDRSVSLLIQSHARKVDEFVSRGQAACHEETPLPEEYSETGF